MNASGSKSRLYDRLCAYLFQQYQKDVDRAKNSLQKQMLGPQPQLQEKAVDKPTDERELERHATTHLPFAAWCDVCVKTKSREDRTLQSADLETEQLADPHIQMDWMYLGRSCPALVLVDAATRFGAILPTRTKGAWRAVAEFCVKFSLELNYLDNVVFVMDSEPATLGLLDMIIMIRQEMGYKSTKKVGKPYHKGRTARVERYIQTVRRQAATLVAGVEEGIREQLDDLHCLRAWALTHSVFLLNRFHEHAAIKATAFEMVHGQKYNGRLLPFGEFVFGLRQPVKQKGSSIWLGGIWVGKDNADMNVIITPGGQFHTRSIRRCSNPWRPDVVQALTMSPWSKHKASGPIGLMEAPLPVIEEKGEGPDPREPFRLGTGGIDEEAEEVAEHVESYEPTEVNSPRQEEQPVMAEPSEPLERLSNMQRKALLDIPVIPSTPPGETSMELEQAGEKREMASSGEQRDSKAARLDREGSPSSAGLYAPFYAGQVEEVDRPHGDIEWEKEVDWGALELEMEGLDEQDFSADKPPEISPEELAYLDGEAMKTEVEKLTNLGVVKVILEHEMLEDGKFVDLKEVFDWRHREGQWKRRCRIVAREFKTGPSTDETFSPTSSFAVVRFFLMLHLFYGWKLASLDISDAYLTVEQQETCYVKISGWIKQLLGLQQNALWQLQKVLPGQRNGAQRWFQDFTHHLQRLGFKCCVAMPSVLKHATKQIAINVHVDDELIASENEADLMWVIAELKKIYKLQVEGPVPRGMLGAGEELNYLKKTYVFLEGGVCIKSGSRYIDKLLRLYDGGSKKEKQVPEHCLLGHPDTSPELDPGGQATFRSGLGIAMYLSQDRLDIQYCVKSLASSMRSPTEQAERCLQQLILYLKGTKNMSFWLPYTQVGTSMAKILNNAPQDELEDTEHLMEIFCDSDWAGSLYRKSTTSVVVLLNSLVVLSYSRTQKAVALSSCEAEVLSLTSGSSEAMLLKEVWQFMVGKRHSISLEARSDSSSGRQWLQRSGIGRLKHIDVRLCWLQDAIRSKVLKALPVPTQTNIADLNTKKLTAMRRKFLLSFMGAIRISEDNTILERIGEEEQTTYFMEQQWKNQVRQVTRWTKNKSSRLFAQCVMMMQAMNLKGCMEHSSDEVVEQDNCAIGFTTIGMCWWPDLDHEEGRDGIVKEMRRSLNQKQQEEWWLATTISNQVPAVQMDLDDQQERLSLNLLCFRQCP